MDWYGDSCVDWYGDSCVDWYEDSCVDWYGDSCLVWYGDSCLVWYGDSCGLVWRQLSGVVWGQLCGLVWRQLCGVVWGQLCGLVLRQKPCMSTYKMGNSDQQTLSSIIVFNCPLFPQCSDQLLQTGLNTWTIRYNIHSYVCTSCLQSIAYCTYTYYSSSLPFLPPHYQHWGFSRITTSATTLTFEYIRDDDGKAHDSLVLKK